MRPPATTQGGARLSIDPPLLISVEEAARLLGLGRTRAYGLVMSGRIVSVKLGRKRLVVRERLSDFVSELVAEHGGFGHNGNAVGHG